MMPPPILGSNHPARPIFCLPERKFFRSYRSYFQKGFAAEYLDEK
jgi:hypothetical protein